MALRAKKPVVKPSRFHAVVYANRGVGKTHFCCSFPNTYYIDTEGLENYEHFVKMINSNNGEIIRLNELSEIISEVKELLSVKHNYKTLVIDSISFPFHLLAILEAERLSKGGQKEGTEFGANLAKAKRQVFELGMLLSRLDMNIIVTAHEKTLYEDSKEIGKIADVNDKLEYALGTVLHLKRLGKMLKAYVKKSRYPSMKESEGIDFNDGYETICGLLGQELFERDCTPEELATPEQIAEFNNLTKVLNIPQEDVLKSIAKARAASIEQISKIVLQGYIDGLKAELQKLAA